MKKILTISVAAYNAARDLPKCLDSITACLNIDKIEIFIVDDGSTDATRDVALKYCIQFPQSVFLISKKKVLALRDEKNARHKNRRALRTEGRKEFL